MNRREFNGLISSIPLLATKKIGLLEAEPKPLPISSSEYNWKTFYSRKNENWLKNRLKNLSHYSKTGLRAIEPNLENIKDVSIFQKAYELYGIKVPSAYANSILHDKALASKSIKQILGIAQELKKKLDTKILVTNPNPIEWNSKKAKSDTELKEQLKNLAYLGKELNDMDIKLAYHTHDMEMLAGAKEFHHMLLNTDPEHVNFCFDLHWVYRGSGNSELAVFDILKMYKSRIIELHLRQSKGGIWEEVFTASGDIEYTKVAKQLKSYNLKPHLVIEQCIEQNSPNGLTAIQAHKKDLENVRQVFTAY